jgi:hypothetical protein
VQARAGVQSIDLRVPDVCNSGGEIISTVAAGEFVVSSATATAAD